MKKSALIASLVAVCGSVGLAQAATTGTITLTGQVTVSTCNVLVNGASADAAVTLAPVGDTELPAAGRTAGRTAFNIALSGCSASLKNASANFATGTSVDTATGRLKNMTGTATNVQLQLRDGTGSGNAVIQAGNANQATSTQYVAISNGTATLPYFVEYYATGQATAGSVISSVVYSIQYK